MRDKFISILQKFPLIHRFIKFWYWKIQYFQAVLFGTKIHERYWQKRHLIKSSDWQKQENKDWVMGYWKSISHPHRKVLVEIISKYSPSSILEIGSNCGPNLYLLAKKFPQAEIKGIDINEEAVKKGNELFAKEGIPNVKLLVNGVDNLRHFKNKSFDIVFTDATLIYIGQDKIKKIVSEMQRITQKAIILVELHSEEESALGFYDKGLWIRNYKKLFLLSGFKTKATKISSDIWGGDWGEKGFIIEIKL